MGCRIDPPSFEFDNELELLLLLMVRLMRACMINEQIMNGICKIPYLPRTISTYRTYVQIA